MSEPHLEDFPSLAAFGDRLTELATSTPAPAAARRRAVRGRFGRRGRGGGRSRGPRRPLAAVVLAVVGLPLLAAAAAAATLLALNGDAIPPFARTDDAAAVRPLPGTGVVPSIRGGDPAPGVPPWALRVSRGPDRTACVAVGQVSAGRFGLLGLDGVFRSLPVRGADSCGAAPSRETPIVGARVFAAPRAAAVRTVLYGLGGAGLRSVAVAVPGHAARTLAVSPQGAFLTTYAGTLDAVHPVLRLRYAGGKTRTVALGGVPTQARNLGVAFINWRTDTYDVGGVRCVRVVPVHQLRPPAIGPSACAPPGRFSFDTVRFRRGRTRPATGGYAGYHERGGGLFTWGQMPVGTRATLLLTPRLATIVPGATANGRVPIVPAADGTFAFTLPPYAKVRDIRIETVTAGGAAQVHRETAGLTFRGSVR